MMSADHHVSSMDLFPVMDQTPETPNTPETPETHKISSIVILGRATFDFEHIFSESCWSPLQLAVSAADSRVGRILYSGAAKRCVQSKDIFSRFLGAGSFYHMIVANGEALDLDTQGFVEFRKGLVSETVGVPHAFAKAYGYTKLFNSDLPKIKTERDFFVALNDYLVSIKEDYPTQTSPMKTEHISYMLRFGLDVSVDRRGKTSFYHIHLPYTQLPYSCSFLALYSAVSSRVKWFKENPEKTSVSERGALASSMPAQDMAWGYMSGAAYLAYLLGESSILEYIASEGDIILGLLRRELKNVEIIDAFTELSMNIDDMLQASEADVQYIKENK